MEFVTDFLALPDTPLFLVQVELLLLLLWCILAMLQKLLNVGVTAIDHMLGKKFETPRSIKGTLCTAILTHDFMFVYTLSFKVG
jgi:hypothetical protein